jgi:hypothetical protein
MNIDTPTKILDELDFDTFINTLFKLLEVQKELINTLTYITF